MGVETIEQLEKIVEDKDFKRYLKEKYEGYCKIHKDAKEKLNIMDMTKEELVLLKNSYLLNDQYANTDR